MTKEELEQFCYKYEDRQNIRQPFSWGEYSYATDGRILVQIPRLADVPERTEEPLPPSLETLRSVMTKSNGRFVYLSRLSIPPAAQVDCCKDAGCDDCNGTGYRDPDAIRVQVGTAQVSHLYLNKIKPLKRVRISQRNECGPEVALYFEFDLEDGVTGNGKGWLMPMKLL